MSSDLLYLQEHISCRHYVSDYRCCFSRRNIKSGDKVDFDSRHNYLIFILGGKAIVSCGEFIDRHFVKGDILFIPKSSVIKFTAIKDSGLIACVFDSFKSHCDKFCLTSYWPICKEMKYDFQPTRMIPQFEAFLESLAYYLDQGVKCEHFHELKHQEMFLIFRWFYSKEQLAQLFYPIIGRSLNFRALVLENYLKIKNVNELAVLSMMGRSSFDIMFKKEFGMSAGQWLLKQKAKHVKFAMSMPEASINDIMATFEFNSATHFNRFCKQQFGCTPLEMITKLKEERLAKPE